MSLPQLLHASPGENAPVNIEPSGRVHSEQPGIAQLHPAPVLQTLRFVLHTWSSIDGRGIVVNKKRGDPAGR